MSATWTPGCEKCGSEEHNGLQQICDNTEEGDVLNVCDKCYGKATKPTCCERCEQPLPVSKYRLTFDDETKTFMLCYDCHENYKHTDAVEEEYGPPTNFCDFCELFYYDNEMTFDRCKKCHDRILAELQAEEAADKQKRQLRRKDTYRCRECGSGCCDC